jgi:hypothetical protein
MMKARILYICLVLALVSGCAGRGPVGSFAGPLPSNPAVASIAADAVNVLADTYPPGHTTLHLLPAKKAENGFALALEYRLRKKGFALSGEGSGNALAVAYTLDSLDEKAAWYLQLRLSDGKVIARSYSADGQPEAGQSRTTLEAVRSGLKNLTDAAKNTAGQDFSAAHSILE